MAAKQQLISSFDIIGEDIPDSEPAPSAPHMPSEIKRRKRGNYGEVVYECACLRYVVPTPEQAAIWSEMYRIFAVLGFLVSVSLLTSAICATAAYKDVGSEPTSGDLPNRPAVAAIAIAFGIISTITTFITAIAACVAYDCIHKYKIKATLAAAIVHCVLLGITVLCLFITALCALIECTKYMASWSYVMLLNSSAAFGLPAHAIFLIMEAYEIFILPKIANARGMFPTT